MRSENKKLTKELDQSNLRMGQCDQELQQASEQLNRLAKEVALVSERNEKYKYITYNLLIYRIYKIYLQLF